MSYSSKALRLYLSSIATDSSEKNMLEILLEWMKMFMAT